MSCGIRGIWTAYFSAHISENRTTYLIGCGEDYMR